MKNLKNHHKSQFDLTTGALQPEEAALQLKPSQTPPFTHWHHSSAIFWPYFCLWLLWKCYAILTFLVWPERMKITFILLTVASRNVSKQLALISCYYIPQLTCTLPFIPLKCTDVSFSKLSCLNFMELGKADWSLWQSLFNTLLPFVVPSFYPKHTQTGWWFMVWRPNWPMWQINFAHLLRTSPVSVSFRRRCP